MKSLSADRCWLVLPLYLLGGFILGLADPLLGRYAQQLGLRPGWATAASVNLVLPFFAIALAVVCPRLRTAWLGAVAMTTAFCLGLACVYPPPNWDAVTLLQAVRPVVVLACLGYGVLGTRTVLVTLALRKSDGGEASAGAASD
jgi:hypothetical protein